MGQYQREELCQSTKYLPVGLGANMAGEVKYHRNMCLYQEKIETLLYLLVNGNITGKVQYIVKKYADTREQKENRLHCIFWLVPK